MPNKKISQFTTVGSINSDDVFLINQTGTTNTVMMSTVSAAIGNTFIKKPATATNGQVLTYDGSTATWAASASIIPAGCVMMWTSSTLPAGWIECNGQSTASYPNLAAVCGANVPDLRGEFVRGWDHGKGTDPTVGRTLKSSQEDDFESHTHSVSLYNDSDGTYFDGAVGGSVVGTGTVGSTGGTETRPRNVALMYIIKT